jgi:hypothetical protein
VERRLAKEQQPSSKSHDDDRTLLLLLGSLFPPEEAPGTFTVRKSERNATLHIRVVIGTTQEIIELPADTSILMRITRRSMYGTVATDPRIMGLDTEIPTVQLLDMTVMSSNCIVKECFTATHVYTIVTLFPCYVMALSGAIDSSILVHLKQMKEHS